MASNRALAALDSHPVGKDRIGKNISNWLSGICPGPHMGFAARVTGGNLMHAQQANKHRVGPSTVKGRDQTYPACVAGSKIKTDTLSGKTDDHLKSRFCEHFYLVEFLKIFYHPVMAHGLLSKTPKPVSQTARPK